MTEQVPLGETVEQRQARHRGTPGLTTEQVHERLAKKYEMPEYLWFTEVPFLHEGRTRLADGVAIPTYESRGTEMHGFEVKVTRADWLRELKEGSKAEACAQHCDRFWLVLGDPAIAFDAEVPAKWGILVPHGDGLKVRRHADLLREERVEWPRRLVVTLARKAYKAANDSVREVRHTAYRSGYDDGKKAASGGWEKERAAADHQFAERVKAAAGIWNDNEDTIARLKRRLAAGDALLAHEWKESPADAIRNAAKDLMERAKQVDTLLKEAAKPSSTPSESGPTAWPSTPPATDSTQAPPS